ncbi:MAG: hypothetical protein SF029_26375 [bacterium]|nr:hypothetical protein [bacterium]
MLASYLRSRRRFLPLLIGALVLSVITGSLFSGIPAVSAQAVPPLPTGVDANVTGNGVVTVSWTSDATATSHRVVIYSWTASRFVYDETFTKAADADVLTCTTACTLQPNDVLPNGEYSVYVNAINATGPSTGGALTNGFAGPTTAGVTPLEDGDFVLNAAAVPGVLTNVVVNGEDTTTITGNWTLTGTQTSASHFVVYFAPIATFTTPIVFDTFSRTDLCGAPDGTTCTFDISSTGLVEDAQYGFYVLAANSAGIATGGDFANGYDGENFFFSVQPNPALPTGLAASANDGIATLSFTSNAVADLHSIVIYSFTTNAFIYSAELTKASDADALTCTGTACTFNTADLDLSNGSYSFYVNSIDTGTTPRTVSIGGPFANGYAGPQNPTNTTEAGDLVLNFTAPPLVTGVAANGVTGATPTATWTVPAAPTGISDFYIYFAPLNNFGAPLFSAFVSRDDVCGTVTGTSCTFDLDDAITGDLQEDTQYGFYVLSAGPGGFSTGDPNTNGFVGVTFTINQTPNPAFPTALAANLNNGIPTLTFTSDAIADAHGLAIYSFTANTFVYANAQLTKAADSDPLTCSGTACTFNTASLNLGNGSYSFYVNAIDTGTTPPTVTTGGTFANGYVGPENPTATNEPGDFVINATTPPLVTNIQGSFSGGNLTITWTTSTNATYFNIVIGTGTVAAPTVVAFIPNVPSTQLNCNATGATCTYTTSGLTFAPGTYAVAVQAGGPGGIATTGGPFSNGYALSGEIVLSGG